MGGRPPPRLGRGGAIEGPRIEPIVPLEGNRGLPGLDPLAPGLGGAADLARLGDTAPPPPPPLAGAPMPGVLNPPDTSALANPPSAPPPQGSLSRLWDGVLDFFGLGPGVSGAEEGGRAFQPPADDAAPDPAAARRAVALDLTPADDLVRGRPELDRRFGEISRRFSIYRMFQFPHSPELDRLGERFDALNREYDFSKNPLACSDPYSRDWSGELTRITDDLNVFLGEQVKSEVRAGATALRDLARASGDPTLDARIETFATRMNGARAGSFDADTALGDFRRLLTDVVGARARRIAAELGMTSFPASLERGLDLACENIANLHVIGNGLSGRTLENFVYSAVEWANDFPPPEGTGTIDFLQPFLVHHFVLGTRPSADRMLATVTNNLEGYRQLFGERAGAMFYRQERLVAPVLGQDGQPTGFYMTVERGSHEYDTGLRVAVWEGDPAGQHEHAPVARLGFNFGADRSIEIVNLQGPSRELREMDWRAAPRPGAYDRLQAALGGGRPFNMMLGMVIHWAHGAGIQRVYGIRDEAQGARASGLERAADDGADTSGRAGMYRMIFGTFGFKSRADNPDYVVLDLTRGSHEDYMAKVLRKGAPRNEAGQPSDAPGQSFWGTLVPAWNFLQPVGATTPYGIAAPGANPVRIPPR